MASQLSKLSSFGALPSNLHAKAERAMILFVRSARLHSFLPVPGRVSVFPITALK
jgi:hypothetical protein